MMISIVSCNGGNDPQIDDGLNHIVEDGKTNYTIVCPVGSSDKEMKGVESFQRAVNEICKAEIALKDDSSEDEAYEILIGDTDREETLAAKELLGDEKYVIACINGKLAIYAKEEKYYQTAVGYLRNIMLKEGRLTLEDGYIYRGGNYTLIFTEDTVGTERTVIEMTFLSETSYSRFGIFIGSESESGIFGYKGYAFFVDKSTAELYRVSGNMGLLASKKHSSFAGGERITLRMEIEGNACRCYILDDGEGCEPWPEFEIGITGHKGMRIGAIESTGRGIDLLESNVTYSDRAVYDKTYMNPIYSDYADPDVLYHDGKYYLYATGGSGYAVHTSDDLVNWKKEGIAVSPDLWGITKNYWAPDVEYINGKFYMVVSCNENLGLAVSDSPTGPFKAMTDKVLFNKTIDGHLFQDDDGRVYLYYVSWRKSYGIYGVELDGNMMPIESTERLIIQATEDWEKQKGNITEGPYMLKHNGVYYMTYSGSHYESIDYAVGYAVSDSPLGTFKKHKNNPIMIGNSQIHGVGHHCIVATPEGEMVIVYHCHNSLSKVQVRKLCIDRIRFSPVKDDIDRLEIYGPTTMPQPYPKV